MCAAPITTQLASQPLAQKSDSPTSKSLPKWMKMKQQNKSSAGKTEKPTVQKSLSSAQPNKPTRDQKRARWAKRSKPVAKTVAKRGPEKEYISVCCSVPARKPKAGAKEMAKDAETGKMQDKSKGLGKWRCPACSKICKVTPRKPEAKPTGNMANLSCPDVVYPAKMHVVVVSSDTPDLGRGAAIIQEVPIANA